MTLRASICQGEGLYCRSSVPIRRHISVGAIMVVCGGSFLLVLRDISVPHRPWPHQLLADLLQHPAIHGRVGGDEHALHVRDELGGGNDLFIVACFQYLRQFQQQSSGKICWPICLTPSRLLRMNS
jgi:hypothetical protein